MNRWIVLVLLLIPSTAWWDGDWNFSKPLTADRNESLAVGWLSLDTASLISSGKMRYDCGALRVVGKEGVGYYVVGCNSSHTDVFFDVDSSLAETDIYYGNPSAGSSANAGIFSFYDGFEDYSTGTDGSPVWTVEKGSFQVNYTNRSQKYMLNSSGESIATSFSPSGNFTVYAEIIDPGNGNVGVVYSYINSTHYFAAYLNGSEVWVRENTSAREVGSFTSKDTNYLLVDVFEGEAEIFVNGNSVGTANYTSRGSSGVYADPSGSSDATVDEFAVFPLKGLSWSAGAESSRPALLLEFIGSEAANMRTFVMYMDEGEETLKITPGPQERTGLISGSFANLSWADIYFNSTGYSVNGSFIRIDADAFNYTQGNYRIDLSYVKTGAGYRSWHIVQFFYNYPAVKHVVFITANETGNYSAGIYPWESCSSYVSVNGTVSCTSSMHASSGVFNFGDASVCGLHRGSTGPFRIYETVPMENKESHKEIFWESYMGCEDFTQEVEHLCGTDFFNCTASTYVPVKTLFYVNEDPMPLTRVEYPSGFSCTINGETVQELVNSENINKGLNDLECSGSGNFPYFRLYSSPAYEATRFFGEKPEVYRATVNGPLERGKIGVCGIPVLSRIMPFKCAGDSLFFEEDFGKGSFSFYIFKTDGSWSYREANGGPLVSAKIARAEPPQPPMASAKELGDPITPSTHKVITSRRLIYSNSTALEVVITAWRTI